MSKPVRVIPGDSQASLAWEQMRLHQSHHLVVTGPGGEVVGVISAGDLGGIHGKAVRSGRCVADLMTDPVIVVEPETTVREAANLMRGHHIACLPVVQGESLKGIVTALDLLELIGRGAERPMATTGRRVMKDRGSLPRVLAQAKRGSRAKGPTTR
jgi:acetoin utilization protein AcuB